jgi:hypothetical protein
MEKEVIYIDDTGVELDMALVSIPHKFRELFASCHFANMKEFNDELRTASICASGGTFGWCPADRKAFIKRMEARKR